MKRTTVQFYLLSQALIAISTTYTVFCLIAREDVQTVHVSLPVEKLTTAPVASPTPEPTIIQLESGRPFKIQL